MASEITPRPAAAPRLRGVWLAALAVMLIVVGLEFAPGKTLPRPQRREWRLVASFAGRTPGQAGQFQGALQTVVDARGRLLLVDPDQAKVVVWQAPEGGFLFELTAKTVADPNFSPRDAAVGPAGEIFVLDAPQGLVWVFGPEGKVLRKWPAPGARGLATEKAGTVLVTPQEGTTVVRFDAFGRKLGSFGARGEGSGQLRDPYRLAVNAEGEIAVLDTGNRRIALFAADGSWLGAIKLKFDPTSVTAVQSRGGLWYVNDFMGGAIYVYRRSGWLAEKIPLGGPSVLAVDDAGNLYSAGPQGMGRYRAVTE